jgi:hypothetical protein
MRNLLIGIAILAAIAVATAYVAYRISGDTAVRAALAKRDALEWLRTDFQLTDAQFASIRRLHESYSVVCEEHCRAIQEATRERNAQRARLPAGAPEVAAAEQRVQELRLICETAIAAHVRQVAAEMSPDAGRRYLELVLPRIADFDHQAAPTVRIEHPRH